MKNGFKEFYMCVKDDDGDVIYRDVERHRDREMTAPDMVWRYMNMLEKAYWRMCE